MKTNLLRTLLLLIPFIAFLTACDKDKEDDPEPTPEELLTASEWHGDKILVNGADVSTLPAQNVPDAKSITIKFNEDHTYTATFTQNGSNYQTNGTWALSEDGERLSGNLLGFASDAEITKLTDKNLNLSISTVLQGFPTQVQVRLVR